MKYAPRFTAVCPSCQQEVDQGTFRMFALQQFLDDGTLRFYCPACNAEWEPNARELANIERLLSEPAAPVSFKVPSPVSHPS